MTILELTSLIIIIVLCLVCICLLWFIRVSAKELKAIVQTVMPKCKSDNTTK